MPRRRWFFAALAAGGLLATGSCAADESARMPEAVLKSAPPSYQARSGVPLLMDLPVLGFLFRSTTTVR